jgi:hypothetical protein
VHTTFWSEILKGRGHPEECVVDRKVILEWILEKKGEIWTGCIWIRIGTSGGLL